MLAKLYRFLQPVYVIGAVAVIAVGSVAFALFYTSPHTAAAYVTPTEGQIVQEVDSDGTVKAAQEVDLSFQIGGEIAYAGPAVGTHVDQGATLVSLVASDLKAAVEAAQAALETQQANLATLQAGATPQNVTVGQTAVSNAQASVTQTRQSLIAAAQNAYATSDDAIHNKVDQFFNNPRSSSPSLDFTLTNSQDQASIVAGRIQMESLLSGWQSYVNSIPSDPSQIDPTELASTTRANLEEVSSYLDLVATGLTEAVPSTAYNTATLQGYAANVATARTNVSTDITALDAAASAEKTAESSLASAQSQLSLTTAPATSEQIQAQQGQVGAAQANVDAAQAQLAKAFIVAPFSGTITVNNANVGEIASPDTPEISMISDSQFQFETYVSETDLAKVQVGQEAQITLDAYQGQTPFAAHIIEIDPAATIQNGISSYKVTLQFDQNDPRIQAGLTGSAKIITDTENDALSVPTSAIITQGTQYFVIEKTSSGDQQVQVTTGISSASGMTQILSGISASDEIRTFGDQQ